MQNDRPSFVDAQKVPAQPVLRDAPWILISVAVWVVSVVLFAIWVKEVPDLGDDVDTIINVLITSTFVAIVWGFAWLGFVRRFHNKIVLYSLILTPTVLVAVGVVVIVDGGSPVVFFVWAVLFAIWAYFRRSDIPFVTAILSSATTCLVQLPGLMVVQIVSVLLNVGWAIFFIFFAIFGVVYMAENDETDANSYLRFFIITWLLYTMCKAINQLTSHVIVCGSVASWWLTPNDPSPIGAASHRACRYSFGSISIAAVLITFFEAIRVIIGTWLDNACCNCCWGWIKKLIQLYSSYALVRVAVFNESFCQSAEHTGAMIKASGMSALTNDSFVWIVCYLGSGIMGALHGLITVLIWSGMYSTAVFDNMGYMYGIWLIGFLIGQAMTKACLMPIDSAIRTTYVLWTEAQQIMLTNRPDQMQPILDAYAKSKFYTAVQGQVQQGQPVQGQPAAI